MAVANLMAVRAQFSVSPPPPKCTVHSVYNYGCRACLRRHGWLDATRTSAIEAGVWEGQVDAAEAREHLRRYLRRAGRGGSRRAAEESRLSLPTITDVTSGRNLVILSETRDRILELDIPARRLPVAGHTYVHGTRRRIAGLALRGVRMDIIAGRAGLADRLSDVMRLDFVAISTAEVIAKVTVDLVADPPPRSPHTAGRAARAACPDCAPEHAGWHPLDFWYEIDDPDDLPPPPPPPREDIEEVLVEKLLKGEAKRLRPACYLRHVGDGRTTGTCYECLRWVANRNEAIRRGTLAGMGAKPLGERVGASDRTVVRVRVELGLVEADGVAA